MPGEVHIEWLEDFYTCFRTLLAHCDDYADALNMIAEVGEAGLYTGVITYNRLLMEDEIRIWGEKVEMMNGAKAYDGQVTDRVLNWLQVIKDFADSNSLNKFYDRRY